MPTKLSPDPKALSTVLRDELRALQKLQAAARKRLQNKFDTRQRGQARQHVETAFD